MNNKVAPEPVQEDVNARLRTTFVQEYNSLAWYTQTYYSCTVAWDGVWKRVVRAHGGNRCKETLKSFWTTMGIVSALLLSISFGSMFSPLKSDDPGNDNAVMFVNTVLGCSLVFSFTVVIISTIYIIEIDHCATVEDLDDFIVRNSGIFDFLTGIFSASVVLLFAAGMGGVWVTQGKTTFYVVVGTAGTMGLYTGAVAAYSAGITRFKLWARYDSPMATALNAKGQPKEC